MKRANSLRIVALVALVAMFPLAESRSLAGPRAGDVSLTGLVTCMHCVGNQPIHKGFTPWTWALYSVSQGDEVILVVSDKTYKLQGDKGELLKFIADKATITGRLDGDTIAVASIARP